MKIKQLVDILTASLGSLKREGKFARTLLWKHARASVFQEIYNQAGTFVSRFVRIAAVGALFSVFEEGMVLKLLKQYWIPALCVFVGYILISKLISATLEVFQEKGRILIDLELSRMIWTKNQSVGIGTRVGSQFRQKLRTARRCSSYDVKSVGLWPVEAAAEVLSALALLTTLAFLNWRVCVIFVATASVTAYIGAYMARWVRTQEKGIQEFEDRADEYNPASLSIDSTFLGISAALFERAMILKGDLLTRKIRFHRKALMVMTLVGSLATVALAVQLYLTRDSLFQSASLMEIGITVSTIGMSIGTLTNVMRALFGEQNSIEDVRELQEFLEFQDEERTKDDSSFPMAARDIVRLVEVHFAYPYVANSPNVIRGISLELIPGEAAVVVGENGSGKTTMSNLLANIHRPQKGCVMYGSVAIGGHTARSVMEHTLVIPQSGDLHDLPLAESLFGVLDMSAIDMNRYTKALAMSGARAVLDRLPNGIHTQIGTAYTGGTDLSGGEKQRLRLAGYFYKALDPQIKVIVADEPSRYLDPETRGRVYSELISLARDLGKIVVVISHDADLERFDRVVILQRGLIYGDYRGEKISEAVRIASKSLAGEVAASD